MATGQRPAATRLSPFLSPFWISTQIGHPLAICCKGVLSGSVGVCQIFPPEHVCTVIFGALMCCPFARPQLTLVDDKTNEQRLLFVNDETKESTFVDPRISKPGRGGTTGKVTQAPAYSRDFKAKSRAFRAGLRQDVDQGQLKFTVRRGYVFSDTWDAFRSKKFKATDLQKPIYMKFAGEDGLDFGGLAREWFFLLSRDMLNPLQVCH